MAGDTVPPERDCSPGCDEAEARRKFLQTIGKWSAVAIAAAVTNLGDAVTPREAHGMCKCHEDLICGSRRCESQSELRVMPDAYSGKWVRIRNHSGQNITVEAQWHDGNRWHEWGSWNFRSGERSYLASDGSRILAKWIKICAKNNVASWGDCSQVITVCESNYYEPIRTWDYTFTP